MEIKFLKSDIASHHYWFPHKIKENKTVIPKTINHFCILNYHDIVTNIIIFRIIVPTVAAVAELHVDALEKNPTSDPKIESLIKWDPFRNSPRQIV